MCSGEIYIGYESAFAGLPPECPKVHMQVAVV